MTPMGQRVKSSLIGSSMDRRMEIKILRSKTSRLEKRKVGQTSSLKRDCGRKKNALAHQSTKVIGSAFNDFLEMDFKLFGWANIENIFKWWNMKTILEGRYTAGSNLWRFKSKKRLFQQRRF